MNSTKIIFFEGGIFMALSEEMQKMVEVVKKYDNRLRCNNESYRYYFAPDIPEKVFNKLIKNFDRHIAINSIVAVYDTTLFGTCKEGVVFTSDGVYFRDILEKPVYFQYKDIQKCTVTDGNLELDLVNCNENSYTHISSFDKMIVKFIIEQLKGIDEEYGQTTYKVSGKVKKMNIPKDMMDKCNGIIHGAAVACGGVGTGLAQIPASDNAVIVPIQIGMIVGLGAVFELNITESAAKSIIASAGATVAGRTVSQILVGWIPGIGNAFNMATAAGITEVIGWIAVKNFYERWIQDRNKGRFEGMKDGYTEASGEYERKLRKQAEEFLKQMKNVEREHDEYEKLLDDYERYIKELEEKCAANDLIKEMKDIYHDLQELQNK